MVDMSVDRLPRLRRLRGQGDEVAEVKLWP